jgi:hypothetical protein
MPASAVEQWAVAVSEQGTWLIGVRQGRRVVEEGGTKLTKAKEGITGGDQGFGRA